METGREALEGGFKLRHVRRTKLYLFIIQIIIVLAAVVYLTAASKEVQVKPFYLPVGSFIYFVILVALIICAEGFVFKALEMKYTKSSSTKYYVIKTSVKRGMIIIVISVVVIALLLTPFLSDFIANVSSEAGKTDSTASFFNRDPLGLTACNQIYVVSNTNAEVLVVSEDNYNLHVGDMTALRQFAIAHTADASPGIYLDFPSASYGKYIIVVNSDVGATVHYTVHKTITSTFVDFVTLFAVGFIAIYAMWIAYLTPLRKKYSKGAIYR